MKITDHNSNTAINLLKGDVEGFARDQIFIPTTTSFFPEKAFEYACKVAQGFDKEVCLISLDENPSIVDFIATHQPSANVKINYMEGNKTNCLTETLESAEASMIVFELSSHKPFNNISYLLKLSRGLRIPYIFVKENQEIKFDRIIVPVTFLTEEKEKGRFANNFGRFMKSEITLLRANDYGSKAQHNTNAIKTLLDKYDIKYEEIKAGKDSYKVEAEAIQTASHYKAEMAIITASREYGLDDLLFGPKELHIIRKAQIPVMLLNPRGDLYVLCG
jgi:nucleotide-binding universal stress UspA family protein